MPAAGPSAPPPSPPTPPANVPASTRPSTGPVTPTPPPPRSGDLQDQGAVLRPSVRARSWTLNGRAKVLGPVELDQLSAHGDLAIAGPATVDRWETDGHVTVEGEARGGGPWTCAGEHRFGASLSVQSLNARGRLDVGGPLTSAQAIVVLGTLDVTGDVRGASVAWNGAAAISGEVRASTIAITTVGPSKVGALRADTVRVDRHGGRFAANPATLEVLEIEAKEVHLTGVVAQHVKAGRITVGPGCRLAQVDGTVVSRDPSSHIGPQSKSPTPYGLTR